MESFAIIANGWKRKAVNYFRKTLHFAPQGFEFASTGEGKKKPLGKTKRTQNQSKKVKHTTISSKGIMPYLEEYFSLQKSCNETNKSDEKCQENNQEEEEERNFLWNVSVKLMQRTMLGFKVITAISRHMFIASCILQNKNSQKTESATDGFLQKNVLLKFSQNSKESTCVKISFLIKLQPLGVFLWVYEIFKNTFSTEHIQTTASEERC